jgi:uncharacterized YigZ family protein
VDSYLTIGSGTDHDAEIEIKKSRFIGRARRCASEEDARELVADARREHHTARHHCSAWVIGADRRLQRSNDDGEPGGTAGQPILDVLNGRLLSDIAVVVTRYFGGTLLGAGGLVRAYSEAAAAALDGVPLIRRQQLRLVSLDIAHDAIGRVESALRNQGYTIEDVAYAEQATLTIATADVPGLEAATAQLTGFAVALIPRGTTWVDRDP